jgi:tRNA dimethylallyltransferase
MRKPKAVSPGVLILGGPTASGKSELALLLAERYGCEIVGADSRQIYRDMPIGTAAPTAAQQRRVPHHLVAFVSPYERYSAARYVADAAAAISGIHARGRRVIVVGGTGFYLRALAGEVDLAAEPDPSIRARLLRETQTHPLDVLHAWLRVRDPQRAAALAPGDRYRIVRALEVRLTRTTARLPTRCVGALPTLRALGVRYTKVALRIEPAALADRIGLRTDAMLADGLIAEAERIGAAAVAADAVGYREALAYIAGWLTWGELRATLTRATRRYAKRQLTWFRGEPDTLWIDAGDLAAASAAAEALGWQPR